MPTPSLLIVPARFKSGKLYSQIPTSGAGDFTVTRATAATRVNASGFIDSVASGIPRLDYFASGGTVGCPALLVEPAATNLAPNANLMNILDTPTVSGGVTFTTGSTDFLAPDGTSATINKYVGGAASGATQSSRYSTTAITATASGVHTFSLFVKRGATNPLDFCAITPVGFTSISPSPGRSFFNLASGTAITSGARIENYGNGWYRLISQPLTLAAGDLIGGMSFELASTSGSISFATSGALNLTAYTWGAQFEAGSVATSYIPTTTGSVTRNADVVSVSGAVSGSIGQTEGTIYAEFINTFSSSYNDGMLIRVFADANNEVFGRKEAASNRYTFRWRANSQNTTFTNVNVPDGVNKVALAYKSGDTALFLNGVQIGSTSTDVRAFSVNPTTVALGSNGGAGQFFNDRIRALALYTTRLTNDQLAAITQL